MRKREYKKPDQLNMLWYLIKEVNGSFWCHTGDDYEPTLVEALTVIWEVDEIVLRVLNLPCNLVEEEVQEKIKNIVQSAKDDDYTAMKNLEGARDWVCSSELRIVINRDLVNEVRKRWGKIKEERKRNGRNDKRKTGKT